MGLGVCVGTRYWKGMASAAVPYITPPSPALAPPDEPSRNHSRLGRPSSLVIPTNGRDLQCALRLSQSLPWKRHRMNPPATTPTWAAPPAFVISAEAKRSGGTCGILPGFSHTLFRA
jgi:hypothetical protein